jgi:CheY-like chemotaxis protein
VHPSADEDSQGVPKKILVVEDSDLLHHMYALLLMRYRNAGCQVLHAYNGQQAFEKLAEHPDCDLILLDLIMPVMDGYAFLDSRKKRGLYEDIPVILITTRGTQEDLDKGLQAGALAYLTKPLVPSDFNLLVRRIMTAKKQ